MLKRLQEALLALGVRADRRAFMEDARRFAVGVARVARRPADMVAMATGVAEAMEAHAAETGSWVGPEALANGEGGAFDACDLRHWLALADRAGVPAVPARTILTLTEEEMSALSGVADMPDVASVRRMRSAAATLRAKLVADGVDMDALEAERGMAPPVDPEALQDRLADAMDDVPEGWMVRSARCGGSNLKTLSGFGATGPEVPEVRFGPDLEIGPGWVRLGNRRMVDATDHRTVEAAAQGPGETHFLARPWVRASRWNVGPDPHRHGTPFAGKGAWPAEWRAIVAGGRVIAIASYYGWSDSATPETARTSLVVRELAQRIVDEALAQGAFPRYWDVESVRSAKWLSSRPDLAEALDGPWGRGTVACTLDFIETADGPMLLEGGPSVSPFGGGHPCAFAGVVSAKVGGTPPKPEGVAFRLLPGVVLADPSTWDGLDSPEAREGRILDWDAVDALARSEEKRP